MQRDYIYNDFRRTCPICGKEFGIFDPDLWAYKTTATGVRSGKNIYLCSWKCLCEYKRRKAERHMAVMEAKAKRERERMGERAPKLGLPGLRATRNAQRMTQQDVAVAAEVTVASISYWEQGRRDPKPEKVRQLCKALGCTEEELRRME